MINLFGRQSDDGRTSWKKMAVPDDASDATQTADGNSRVKKDRQRGEEKTIARFRFVPLVCWRNITNYGRRDKRSGRRRLHSTPVVTGKNNRRKLHIGFFKADGVALYFASSGSDGTTRSVTYSVTERSDLPVQHCYEMKTKHRARFLVSILLDDLP